MEASSSSSSIWDTLHHPFTWFSDYLSGRIRFFIATFVFFKLWSTVTNSKRFQTLTRLGQQQAQQDVKEK